jgi:hypothetical protein
MNPLSMEAALAAWMRSVPSLAVAPIHTGTSADDIPLDRSVFVVEVSSVEQISGPCYRATGLISLRSPALVVSLDHHHDLWQALGLALQDKHWLASEFNRAAATSGMSFAGLADPGGPISLTRQDEAWVATREILFGVRAI